MYPPRGASLQNKENRRRYPREQATVHRGALLNLYKIRQAIQDALPALPEQFFLSMMGLSNVLSLNLRS
jgi:hypothetical protein